MVAILARRAQLAMAIFSGASTVTVVVVLLSSFVTGGLGIRNLTSSGDWGASKEEGDSKLVPALVIFGDSTVDAGNNNYLATVIKADFVPYGLNFAGHVPTGRFTDGLLVTDFISQRLELPLQLPYLDPKAHGPAILTGINFASSASGWFDNTATHWNVKGLNVQYEWYKNWKAEVLSLAGPERGNFIINNALYAISTGTNDWVNNYYINIPLQQKYNPDQYSDFLVQNIRKYVLELYSMGGRNIVVLGLPPLGCVPAQITLHGKAGEKGCVQYMNDVALAQNVKTVKLVDDLNKITPGARLVYIDIYNPIFDAFQDPPKYGFKYARDGCCGTGDLEVAVLCNRLIVSACSDASEHIFWDSFHPTSHFYSQLADYMYKLARPKLLAPPNP